MSALRIEGLHGHGVDVPSLRVEAATCSTIFGPSGSGKTLLLRAIADLDEARGEIWLDDQPRSAMSGPQWRAKVMYLAAESAWWAGHVGKHAGEWDIDVLHMLAFGRDVLDWEVERLSSGERQRLALARALARTPRVLLLDEPTANLDQENTTRVETLLARWRETSGGCLLWVSHDPAQRARVANAAYRMRDGKLEPVDAT